MRSSTCALNALLIEYYLVGVQSHTLCSMISAEVHTRDGQKENRSDERCLGVSVTCLIIALLLNNPVFVLKHTWTLGWLGCLIAFRICYASPDSRTRVDAARFSGLGVCVAFYVTYHGYRTLTCSVFLCKVPLEAVVFVTFIVVQWWLKRGRGGERCAPSREYPRWRIFGLLN